MSMTRRQLLVRGGAAALWASAGAAFIADRMGAFDAPPPFDRSDFPEPGRSAVAVLRAETYDGDLEGIVLDGLRLVRADVRGKSVLLKPNLVEFVKGASINTDPRMVVAAANALRRLGAVVGRRRRGPGPSPRHRGDRVRLRPARGARRRRSAVRRPQRRAARAHAAPDPLHGARRALGADGAARDGGRRLDAEAQDAPLGRRHDVDEELLRLHAGARLRLAEGRLPRRGIPESILDIAAAVRPSLAIVDGIVGMQGDGPIMGDPVPSGVVVVSRDLVAADVTGARLMGMDPEKVGYLMEAGRFLGQARSELIEQRGEDPARLTKRFAPGAAIRVHCRLTRAAACRRAPARPASPPAAGVSWAERRQRVEERTSGASSRERRCAHRGSGSRSWSGSRSSCVRSSRCGGRGRGSSPTSSSTSTSPAVSPTATCRPSAGRPRSAGVWSTR